MKFAKRFHINMKIAQVSTVFESVPPRGYGGTERVISYLTEELVRQGHEVTLFAPGDSITEARLISATERAIRPKMMDRSWMAYDAIQMDLVSELAGTFDVIHFHTDYLHFPITRYLRVPYVTTLHGRLDLPELAPLFRHFKACPLVSISDSQRRPLPWANWHATVYHGLPSNSGFFSQASGEYFAFVGRVSAEKGLDRAIDIAKKCQVPLRIAAKLDDADVEYFDNVIQPMMDDPLITFLGEVGEREKLELLKNAKALLFMIDWPEPFGLVMIEALSCGTPVIAYRHGSVPEIIEDGVTGFIVTSQEEAVGAARSIESIDRNACRHAFESRFSAARMAEDYSRVYQTL